MRPLKFEDGKLKRASAMRPSNQYEQALSNNLLYL